MEWEKSPLTHRELRIVRKLVDGKTSSYYAPCGNFAPDDDSYEPQSMPVEIDLTPRDKEILVSSHEIEHYSLRLRFELPPGTLGITGDELRIGIIDKTGIWYIQRQISDARDFTSANDLDETFYFEEERLTSYQGRPTKDYEFVEERKVKVTELPGFTNGIPDNRDSVTNPILNPSYESLKKLRPDISQSLEACLNELKK